MAEIESLERRWMPMSTILTELVLRCGSEPALVHGWRGRRAVSDDDPASSAFGHLNVGHPFVFGDGRISVERSLIWTISPLRHVGCSDVGRLDLGSRK
jgi:hypothetical protein